MALQPGRANAVPPQVTTGDSVELFNVGGEEPKLPLLEDIMQLARMGDIGTVKELLQQGKVTIDHKDKEGITPMHVSLGPRN